MLSLETDVQSGQINPVTWTHKLLRILAVETLSTRGHPSPFVQSAKEAIGIAINTKLLRAGAERKRKLSLAPENSQDRSESLEREAQELEVLATGIERDYQAKVHSMDANITRIVARKALQISLEEDWMTASYQ